VGNPDGSQIITGQVTGEKTQAIELGQALADDLLNRGAKPILDAVYAQ
jgi:hydroxymethylbilane synthase